MTARSIIGLVALALLAALGIWYARAGGERDAPERAHQVQETSKPAGPAMGTPADVPASDPVERRADAPPVAPDVHVLRGRMADRAARQRLERAIEAARTRRESAGVVPSGSAAAEPATLDKKYIQDVVREAVPLLRECYELARDTTPELSGKLVLEFRIAGEPEVGGLVEEASAVNDTEISRHPVLIECVRETILSLEFVPPHDGGTVIVRYPFVFENDADGE